MQIVSHNENKNQKIFLQGFQSFVFHTRNDFPHSEAAPDDSQDSIYPQQLA